MAIKEEEKKNGMKIVDNMDGMKNATEKLNVALNYFLINSYEIIGAAFASLITQLLVLILFIYVFYFRINFFNNVKKLI